MDEGDKVIIPFPEFALHYQSTKIQEAEILEQAYKEEGKLPAALVWKAKKYMEDYVKEIMKISKPKLKEFLRKK